MPPESQSPQSAFIPGAPDRIIGRGHTAGDFLEAYNWRVIEERAGFLRLDADIPKHCLNPKDELFGGFTPTYVDMVSIFAVRAGPGRLDDSVPRTWFATINMRVDYYEPIRAGKVELVGELEHERGKTKLVTTKFYQDGTLAAHALTTLRAGEPMLERAGEPMLERAGEPMLERAGEPPTS